MNHPPPSLELVSPLSRESANRLAEALAPQRGDLAIDVGCGSGAFLDLLLQRADCRGLGIDPKDHEIERARARLACYGDRVELRTARAEEIRWPGHAAIAICLGATHAFGGPGEAFVATLETLKNVLSPGGRLLVGEGYWKQAPSPDYLAATGMQMEHFLDWEVTLALATDRGWNPILAYPSSTAEWDAFEGAFWAQAERDLIANPDSEPHRERAEHWRSWRRAYETWGRDTLGFGSFVLAAPTG